jgi:hypothetical protein
MIFLNVTLKSNFRRNKGSWSMRDLLIESEARQRMPVWAVSRLYRRADGSYCARPVGKCAPGIGDQAIEKAAHAIKRVALLRRT